MQNSEATPRLDLNTLMHMGVPMTAELARSVPSEKVAGANPAPASN